MNIPTLTTPRLILRPWTLQDVNALFTLLQEDNLLRYFPRPTPPPIEKVEKHITHHLSHWEERGYGHWAVVTRVEQKLIGWNGLEFLPETSETEVAYLLSKSFWGQGLATEAAQAALKFGFEHAGLEKIIGLVHPENIASRRVLEKCGLRLIDQKIYFGMELLRFRIENHSQEFGE
jgi:[ribosomal protein S5]-alanine N-acetyltransferase